jgi:hypothetical protein
LSTLGRVITALSDPKSKQLAPFRDSKLTYILKDALVGNSVTSMLACAHSSSVYYEETLSTLRYASSIKRIKTNASMNAEANASDIIAELRAEVVKLSTQLLSVHNNQQQHEGGAGGAMTPLERRKSIAAAARRKSSMTASSSLSSPSEAVGNRSASLVAKFGGGPEGSCLDSVPEKRGGEEEEEGGDNQASLPASSSSSSSSSSAKPSGKGSSSWLPGMLRAQETSDVDEERDLELAAILSERDELDLQLSLRNKERVGLELQLKSKAKELNKLETSVEQQSGEVDDLVFALEASNTENKYLHDEISRLKRLSRASLNSITADDRDPKAFMKSQVVGIHVGGVHVGGLCRRKSLQK